MISVHGVALGQEEAALATLAAAACKSERKSRLHLVGGYAAGQAQAAESELIRQVGPLVGAARGGRALDPWTPQMAARDDTVLMLTGAVMTGRGLDRLFARPGDPQFHEPWGNDARDGRCTRRTPGPRTPRPLPKVKEST